MGYLALLPDRSTFYAEDQAALPTGADAIIEADGPLHLTGTRVDWSTKTVVVDLELIRRRLIDRLKELRDLYEFGVVTVPQGQLQIDERSQGRLARTIKAAETYKAATGASFVTEWRMFDNSMVPIDLAILGGWTLLIAAQVQHVFALYGARYAEVLAADEARLGDLEADIEGGWDVGAY